MQSYDWSWTWPAKITCVYSLTFLPSLQLISRLKFYHNLFSELRSGYSPRQANLTIIWSAASLALDMLLLIGHVNVQSCLLIIFQHQPISLKYSWLSVEQPIRFDWVLYRYHREFPIHKKMIPMLKCPILCFCLPALIFFSTIKAILKTTSIISNNVFKKRKENRRTKNARRKYKWGRNDLQVYR